MPPREYDQVVLNKTYVLIQNNTEQISMPKALITPKM